MTIPHVFVEGNTETKILEKLKLADPAAIRRNPGGKDEINKRIIDTLGPSLGVEPIRCLVMRDLDSHDGETVDGIRSGVEQALQRMFDERSFAPQAAEEKTPAEAPDRRLFDERDFAPQSVSLSPHDGHDNVFTFQAAGPDIKVALHIATYRCLSHFIKSTVDDYTLNLALRYTTVESFLQENRNRNWNIGVETLINEVRREIPALLQKNGIPQLREAKDYARLYAAVLQMDTSPPVFAERTLTHARESDIREVFAPLLAAAQFLSDDPST